MATEAIEVQSPFENQSAVPSGLINLSFVRSGDERLSKPTIYAADRVIYEPEQTFVIAGFPYINGINTPSDQQLTKHIQNSNFTPESLLGSYVVCIFDHASGKVRLYTDKFSTIAAYYFLENGNLHISSQLSDIQNEKMLSHQSLYDCVYFHMIPAPHTIYINYHKLPAASELIYEQDLRVSTYWLPRFNIKNKSSEAALSKQLKTAMKNAVARCIKPDTAAFLSGGLDSSTVAGMLSELQAHESEAYSIGFSADGYDEMAYARITAKKFGLKLHEYYVTPEDIVTALPEIIPAFDEPFGNSSALPAYFCAKVAKQNGVDTMLAGDGGDELFAGNERYAKQGIFEFYNKIPTPIRRSIVEPLLENSQFSNKYLSKAQSYIRQAKLGLPARLQSYNFLERDDIRSIFAPEFLAQIDNTRPMTLQETVYSRPEEASMLNRMMYLDWQITLADNDLVKVNNACKINNMKVRYPMLDDELLELSLQIEDKLKLKGSRLRHFYKETFKNWLPDETINKSKQGFGLPFGVWMETYGPLKSMAYDSLTELKKRNIIQPQYIDRLIKLHKDGHAAYYGEMIWVLMSLEIWLNARHD